MKITDLPGMKEGSRFRNMAVGVVYAFVLLGVLGAVVGDDTSDEAAEAETDGNVDDAPADTETDAGDAQTDGGDVTETPAETETEADSSGSDTTYQVRVIYDGEWSGSFGAMEGSRTVDGVGEKTIDIDMEDENFNMVSASAQKLDAGDGEMTVQILKDGEVVEESSTSAERGVVTITEET